MPLILVRHGETAWNVTQRFRGRADVPLNERFMSVRQRVTTFLVEIEGPPSERARSSSATPR